jgi:hypothetical protein
MTRADRKRREMVADVRYMLWTGETHVEAIAGRLGTNPTALTARLTRAGRGDLVMRMDLAGTTYRPSRSSVSAA